MDLPVTREFLHDYLTKHRNWVEVKPDVFEPCIENLIWPVRIELEEDGATFVFHKKASGQWQSYAGQKRYCAYRHLWVVPLESYEVYAGQLMVDIRVSLLPPGEPRPERKPCPPDVEFRDYRELFLPFPQNPDPNPDWPDIEPPKGD